VIVGFPGETDEEFAISEAFIRDLEFAGMHVFRYSKRPGTAAARMRNHLPEAVKKARSETLIALAAEQERRYAERHVGTERPVVWEHVSGATQDGFVNVGYTDNYIRVTAIHPRALTGHLLPARLADYDPVKQTARAIPLIETESEWTT